MIRLPRIPRDWPTSLPDYQWPVELGGSAPRFWRVVGDVAFYIGHAIGRMLSVLFEWRPIAVVIRTDGIGDAILFEPALEALGRNLSPMEIHLWAPAATCQIMRACSVVSRRVAIPRGFKDGNLRLFRSPWTRAGLGFLLGFWRYDVAIYPAESPEPLGNWLLCSVRARFRWINSGDTINQFDWQRARAHARSNRILSSRPGSAHELLRNAYLSTQWGGSLNLRKPRLYPTATAAAQAERQMSAWREVERQVGASAIVAVIPAGSQPINRYPADKWRAVLTQLWHEHRALPATLGGSRERSFIDSITRKLGDVPHVRPENPLDVLATALLVGQADALISVDAGLAHAAMAQDVPSVILRIGGDPGRFFPWPGDTSSVVLFSPMPCEGCHNRCHLREAECITGVSPDEIVKAYAALSVSRTNVEYHTRNVQWLKVAG